MVSFYCAAAVLCGIDHAVDHNLASVRNHSRVNRDRVVGGGDGSCAGVASPTLGAGGTRAVAGGLKDTEGAERSCASVRAHDLHIADTVYLRAGELHS